MFSSHLFDSLDTFHRHQLRAGMANPAFLAVLQRAIESYQEQLSLLDTGLDDAELLRRYRRLRFALDFCVTLRDALQQQLQQVEES